MTDRKTEPVEIMDVLAYREDTFRPDTAPIIREVLLEVRLDGRRVAAIACTGEHAEELAIGFLRSEGRIGQREDIGRIEQAQDIATDLAWPGEIRSVDVRTAGGASRPEPTAGGGTIASSGARSSCRWPAGTSLAPGLPTLTPGQAFHLVDGLVEACVLHERTRGTHGAALAAPDRILAVREDIGRHNALDMLSGHALLNGIDCTDKILVRTGRASLEIVSKAACMGIPVLLSLGAPTAEAVRLAARTGITLAGSVRGQSMIVYTHETRIGKTA
ncbi:MAG: formate dehydrogenase accessory sulfurtransferase FdhD [Syntrophaceae bacterium]|nr:formate dehydrogenase accessory sulfurtransferase FdhD [Syntrophaceae bacterium]